MYLEIVYYFISYLLILGSILPFLSFQHWIFRIWEFGRIQILFLQLFIILAGFVLVKDQHTHFWICQSLHLGFLTYNLYILFPYTKFYKSPANATAEQQTASISILSVNVYQFNQEYQRLIDLIREVQPDILLTMESNQAWEDALSVLDSDFPTIQKVAQENTYGMHFYSKLKARSIRVNYFVANDLPSIEAVLETPEKQPFTFFGVHPAPPSPTEEETAKERDGDLLSVAKAVKKYDHPVLVVGDFNNVAWANSSILFRKTSELLDPRIGRGFVSTFHARYKLLRFPIDLFFHSTEVFVEEFKTLRDVGSDHLPLYCRFFINYNSPVQESEVEQLEDGEAEEVEERIEEGIEEESDRPAVVTE